MGSLTFIFTGKIVQSLGGRTFAIILAFVPFIFGSFLRLFFLFQPNAPEVLFYTIMIYSIIRFIQTQKNKWLYIFGIAAGLGLMSKYSVAFFIVGVLVALVISGQRKIFTNRHFYFAGIIGALIFLPNLLWQYQHNFPVIFHMKELKETQLKFISPVSFLVNQLLMNVPTFFVWIAGLYFVSFSNRGRKYRFLAWSYVFLIFLLLFFQGKSYYALGIYPALYAFGAFHLEAFAERRSVIWKYVMLGFPVVMGMVLLPMSLPVAKPEALAQYYKTMNAEKPGVLKWEDQQNHALPQDFADMLGWKEITQKVSGAYNSLTDEEKKKTVIVGGNYGQAGAINFYGAAYNLPGCHSQSASFLLWWPDLGSFQNIILVTDDKQVMSKPFIQLFQSAIVSDSVTNKFAREQGSLIITLKGASDVVREELNKDINKRKSQFQRLHPNKKKGGIFE